MKNIAEIKQNSWMWEIDNNIICLVYFKYKGVGSDEEEIILVWPYWYVTPSGTELLSSQIIEAGFLNH